MSVCNKFLIELYGFMHSLHTFWHVPLRMPSRAMVWRSRSRTRKIEDDARTSPDVWKMVNCSTKGWKTTR